MPREQPDWWPEAQQLRSKGLSYQAIARVLKKSYEGVRYAVNDQARETISKKNIRAYERKKQRKL